MGTANLRTATTSNEPARVTSIDQNSSPTKEDNYFGLGLALSMALVLVIAVTAVVVVCMTNKRSRADVYKLRANIRGKVKGKIKDEEDNQVHVVVSAEDQEKPKSNDAYEMNIEMTNVAVPTEEDKHGAEHEPEPEAGAPMIENSQKASDEITVTVDP